jgi:hypothetical protein
MDCQEERNVVFTLPSRFFAAPSDPRPEFESLRCKKIKSIRHDRWT